MDRKLFGVLSGAQVTILGCTAILAPTALVAAVTYSNVAVVNPTTGTPALIDAGGSLHTTDIIAQYRNNPVNTVKITGYTYGDNTVKSIYTVPAGKALVIEVINTNHNLGVNGTTSGNVNLWTLRDSAANYIGGYSSPNASGTDNASLGSGYVVKSGMSLFMSSYDGVDNNLQTLYAILGYLVPAALAPPEGPSQQAQVPVPFPRR